MGERPSGTVTFLFTDIEGSTRLWHDHPADMAAAISLHDGVVRDVSDRHCGHIFFHAGDGFGVAFNSPLEAVTAAAEMQRQIDSRVDVDGKPLKVRMGLNTGEAIERDGDYLGTPVNIAGRVRDIARGGEVLLSEATRDLVYRALPPTQALRRLRPHRLRGIDRPGRIYRMGTRKTVLTRVPVRVAVSVLTIATVASAVWLAGRIRDSNDAADTTTTAAATTAEAPSGAPRPAASSGTQSTAGVLTIDGDTTLTADHAGAIVIAAHDVVLDCAGHEVVDPEPDDANGPADHLDAGILVYQKDGVTIQNCVVIDHWTGISAVQSEGAWIHHNTVTHTNPPIDFFVRTGIGLSGCDRCTVNSNAVIDIYGDAIDLDGTVDSEVYDNTVSAPGFAIRVIDSRRNSIRANDLANRPGGLRTGGGIGIAVFGHSSLNEIEGNTTRGFLIGIELSGYLVDNRVVNNRGVGNQHPYAACPSTVDTNLIEPSAGEEISNVEEVLNETTCR